MSLPRRGSSWSGRLGKGQVSPGFPVYDGALDVQESAMFDPAKALQTPETQAPCGRFGGFASAGHLSVD